MITWHESKELLLFNLGAELMHSRVHWCSVKSMDLGSEGSEFISSFAIY